MLSRASCSQVRLENRSDHGAAPDLSVACITLCSTGACDRIRVIRIGDDMGNRANIVVVEDQDWRLYYAHWAGGRILDALVGGPELARRYVQTLRPCAKNEWVNPVWADGGALIDFDRRRVLFFGDTVMDGMNERRAALAVLGEVWSGFEIGWAYDGTVELAGYVGAELPPYEWDRKPNVRLARGGNHMCHLVSVVGEGGQLRMWPLWWHLSKAWHGPALIDMLPGRGVTTLKLGKIPEGGCHIDIPGKRLGAWQTADTMGFFQALPDLWPGWQVECWDDRYDEHVRSCAGALRLPELDLASGAENVRSWVRERVFESFEDSPQGHIVKLAGMLSPLAPGFEVSSDALSPVADRPSQQEWARFEDACDLLGTREAA